MNRFCEIILCMIVLLALRSTALGQDETTDSLHKKYKFLHLDANRIQDFGGGMDSIYAMIEKMMQEHKGKISIVHIGDSHLNNAALGSVIRRGLHDKFGNAGKGLILPYSTGVQFRYETVYKWKLIGKKGKKKRVKVKVQKKIPIGPGPLITTEQKVYVSADTGICSTYEFTRATILRSPEGCSNYIANTSTSLEPQFLTGLVTKQVFPVPAYDIAIRSASEDSSLNLNGVVFENDSSGILYHAISIDGAAIPYYLESQYIGPLVKELNPVLIIVSLGTNDYYGKTFVKEEFENNLNALKDSLRRYMPNAKFLFTSPPDCYRRWREEKAIAGISSTMSEFCQINGYAFWDWYTVMGGKKSMPVWLKRSLARKDKVHFTGGGYELEGTLFVEAILNAYRQYAKF